MDTIQTFGVGCMHFAAKYVVDDSFEPETYVNQVKTFLEKYENVSDVSVSLFSTSIGGGFGTNSGDDFLIDKECIIPWPSDFHISFRIHIPIRIQKELSLGLRVVENMEDFRVHIFYCDEFPVLFIVPVNGIIPTPSSKVMILREYLKRNHPNDEKIYLQFLGPSPFHADFYIGKDNATKGTLDIAVNQLPGYDDIFVKVSTDALSGEFTLTDEYIQIIFMSIAKEIGLFYRIVAFRDENLDKETELSEKVDQIADKLFQKKLLLWSNYLKEIKQCSVNALMMEVDVLEKESFFHKSIQELDQLEGLSFFNSYLRERIEDATDTRIQVILKVLKEMESYTQTAILGQQSIIAATVGALIGSILTMIAST